MEVSATSGTSMAHFIWSRNKITVLIFGIMSSINCDIDYMMLQKHHDVGTELMHRERAKFGVKPSQ